MSKCENCGNYIPAKIRVCPHCGKIGPAAPKILIGLALLLPALFGFACYTYRWMRLGTGSVAGFLAIGGAAVLVGFLGAVRLESGLMRARAKRYKSHKHIGRDFRGGGYCSVCGKLCEHQWHLCKCVICHQTRDENHSLEGDVCALCGKTQEEVQANEE
jgi:hypothetical protein